ncbi:MAG: polysaccharide deacetylase family protein [Dorea sp.]|jgi:peptidoglycan/xylan/chitin deacetylase (PgdA/CDA1 family)|nr:polysaccharide deacetylase family protein [Dorea sp.]MCI9614915.1 polysaccharide deacetylase family protein [Dorea sp.]
MKSDRIKERELLREKRIKKVKRVRRCLRFLTLLVLCAVPLFFLTTATASRQGADIFLRLTDTEILQGEEVPVCKAKVEVTGNTKVILDKDSGYTAADLIEELERGEGYSVVCDADTAVEGEYPMHLQLEDRILASLDREWVGNLRIDTLDAALTVKNAVGEWDGDQFRRYDGTYVVSDFVVSKGIRYYFGADGKRAAGWQDIGGGRYFFDSDGIMKTGWLEHENAKYYLEADGRMAVGWKDMEDKKYYFDQEGKMASGTVYLGMTKCTFSEDGVLEAMEESKIDPGKPMVALTFDDGPGKRTGELLEVIAQYHAHATFFMQGKNIPSYQDVVKRMKEIGCELGSHSFDHPNLSKLDEAGIRSQLDQTNQNLINAAGQAATVLRPPYGAIGSTLRAAAGMPLILWNIDTLDWKTRNAQATIDTVMQQVKDGDIILMHDIHSESVDAAIELIPKLIAEGYQLVTVSEMAAAKGVTMQNGEKYTNF